MSVDRQPCRGWCNHTSKFPALSQIQILGKGRGGVTLDSCTLGVAEPEILLLQPELQHPEDHPDQDVAHMVPSQHDLDSPPDSTPIRAFPTFGA